MSETYAPVARADDIALYWPDGREMPAMIRSVADYMAKQEWLSIGATRMIGDRMDDHWIENGADLWTDFGCFMRLPEGSRVAQWFRDGETGEPPVVLIGSEGQMVVLANDLQSFLAAWALGEFDDAGNLVAKCATGSIEIALPSELVRDEDDEAEGIPNGRPAFAKFLQSLLGRHPCEALKPKPDDALLQSFFQAWGETQRAEIASNPNLRKIAAVLDAFVPRGKNPWEHADFRIAAIGDRIEIGGKGNPKNPLEAGLADQIRPLISAERERRAAGVNSFRGLWYVGHLMLMPDGVCQLAADWESEPKFFHGPPPTAAELAGEFKRFPKSERWMREWMGDLR